VSFFEIFLQQLVIRIASMQELSMIVQVYFVV
jgi:hypothetical protein